jgi:predicted RNase H-like HicB family nuclease
MRFKVLISEGEDGLWLVVECPSLPGCFSQGRTIEEALENIKDAMQGCLDVLGEMTCVKQSERMIEVDA